VNPVKRDAWLYELRRDEALEPMQRFAAFAIGTSARADGSQASQSALSVANTLGQSERTARRHIAALLGAGWLVQTERGRQNGKRGVASKYALSLPVTQMASRECGPTGHDSRSNLSPGWQAPLSKEREAPSGAPSPAVGLAPGARDDTRATELETYWSWALQHGGPQVLDWLTEYGKAAGAVRAAWWLTRAAATEADADDVLSDVLEFTFLGLPDGIDAERAMWFVGINSWAADEAAEVTWEQVRQIHATAKTEGLSERVVWAGMYCLAIGRGIDSVEPAEIMSKVVGKKKAAPPGRIILREAAALTHELAQVTERRKAAVTADQLDQGQAA
jgi:hypothetical protein